jgi:hypothetical protein
MSCLVSWWPLLVVFNLLSSESALGQGFENRAKKSNPFCIEYILVLIFSLHSAENK